MQMNGQALGVRRELYACVYAKEFPAQAMLRLRPEVREKAVAVMEGVAPLEEVCSLNARARKLGIARGMTRVEVDTFDSVAVLRRSTAEEAAARTALLECAGTFSPRVEERSDRSAFVCAIDVAGTEKLFGPPRALAESLLGRVRALGVAASVAVSSNFDAAICCARGMRAQTAVIAPGSEGAALAPLPIAVLDLSAEHAEIFSLWGIRTLGALAALPEKELIARLGQEGRRLRQLARGELPHLFVPLEPEFRLEERMELDAPVELLESLLFVIGVMLEQLVLRATARVLALAAVSVELKLEGGGTHARTVRPALPSNDRKMWLKLLHLDLEAHPPGAAAVGIVLTAEPGSTSKVQMGLFSPQLPEPMRLDVTLARIKAIVGEECVGSAVLADTHRPDSFRMQRFSVSSEPVSNANEGAPDRSIAAMRQLRPAGKVAVILRGQQPSAFTFRERRYEVERAYGPWLACGDWWNPSLWGVEQWDLIARASDGGLLCCCVVLDLMQHGWSMMALYD
ncbi:MAG: DNA polymerase Y family protein [Acidobacteriaceae bacterium]